jgi:hypothetical protein
MSIFQNALMVKGSPDPKSVNTKTPMSKPEAVNLTSSDTLSFSKFTTVNHYIPSSFIRFFFVVLFLIRLLGWQSTFVAIIVTAVSVPVHTMVIKRERAAQKGLVAARDKRTKAITEALHALRHVL